MPNQIYMVHGQESSIHIADTSIQCVKCVCVWVWGGGMKAYEFNYSIHNSD
jgi:hypothetical protein